MSMQSAGLLLIVIATLGCAGARKAPESSTPSEEQALCDQFCARADECSSEGDRADCLAACPEEYQSSPERVRCGSIDDCDLFQKCVTEM